MDLNKAMVIGRLTRDPEVKAVPSGANVASFSVATNLVWNDQSGNKQEKVEYHNVVAWRKLADICGQYLQKGKKVYIEGRLQTRDWEAQDGSKRYRTEIVADNMIMLDGKGDASGGGYPENVPGVNKGIQQQQSNSGNNPATEAKPVGTDAGKGKSQGEEEINIEDIPF